MNVTNQVPTAPTTSSQITWTSATPTPGALWDQWNFFYGINPTTLKTVIIESSSAVNPGDVLYIYDSIGGSNQAWTSSFWKMENGQDVENAYSALRNQFGRELTKIVLCPAEYTTWLQNAGKIAKPVVTSPPTSVTPLVPVINEILYYFKTRGSVNMTCVTIEEDPTVWPSFPIYSYSLFKGKPRFYHVTFGGQVIFNGGQPVWIAPSQKIALGVDVENAYAEFFTHGLELNRITMHTSDYAVFNTIAGFPALGSPAAQTPTTTPSPITPNTAISSYTSPTSVTVEEDPTVPSGSPKYTYSLLGMITHRTVGCGAPVLYGPNTPQSIWISPLRKIICEKDVENARVEFFAHGLELRKITMSPSDYVVFQASVFLASNMAHFGAARAAGKIAKPAVAIVFTETDLKKSDEIVKKCECGGASVGSPKHPSYCPLY